MSWSGEGAGWSRISARTADLEQGRAVANVRNVQVKRSLWSASLNSLHHSRFKPLLHKEYKLLWRNFSTELIMWLTFKRTNILVWLLNTGF